jgi:hypothetical protein
MMIKLTISSNVLSIAIPAEMKSQAPLLLKRIWRHEFGNKSNFILELSEAVQEFVEDAKLSRHVLVCH